ncbi:hypothetical protein SAMN05920897_10918 [Alkalispirochaeta americana]|uniref:Uncharacterized protein n=1 Tax=Alkalispirochaeta americana TaxID=159291 RepID=A0A1N6SVP2_9SPIO|nr:hypothetical protein [Alkalispirochaeta americana]SIQ45077.1 hypothetical protein SAMN05920897_10918 [Alkalispirochaeta americana]
MSERPSVILDDVVQRENVPLNRKEQEVMALILRKFVCKQLGDLFQQVKPDIAAKVRSVRSLQELKPLFPLLHRAIRENWITDNSFFDVGWQDFIELSKRSYLQLNPKTRISQIRPGFLVKNMTRSNFYGIMLTMDYCTMGIHADNFSQHYPFALKYFTLSFERNPDDVLQEFRFFNQAMVTEVLLGLMSRIGAATADPGVSIREEFDRLGLKLKTTDNIRSSFEYLKKLFYISMIHNHAIVMVGRKTNVGYVNEKHELLTACDSAVQGCFRRITTDPGWTLDDQTTDLALQIQMRPSRGEAARTALLPNLIRAILESVRSEFPLIHNESPLRSRKIKQGMERELQPDRYYRKVIDFLMEHQALVQQIIRKHREETA